MDADPSSWARAARFSEHDLLGTVVSVAMLDAPDPGACADAAFAEVRRLEKIFSTHRADSELNRWAAGESAAGTELAAVLTAALDLQERSAGAFHTEAGAFETLWREAERTGIAPSDDVLAALAAAISTPCYRIGRHGPELLRAPQGLTLNAIAKGYIADAAAEAAALAGASAVVVNAGGDLRHRGEVPVRVAVDQPGRGADNRPPLATIEFANAGVATSGSTRRGFAVGTARHSHVIDPRTGRPVAGVPQLTVVASTAMLADGLATAAGTATAADAPVLLERLDPGAAALAVDTEGRLHATAAWAAISV